MSCYDLCRPCGPTPLANSCNEPCVRQCQDSRVIIEPSPVVVTLPGPILSSFPQNTAVGSSTSAAVGSILSESGVPINSGGFGLSGLSASVAATAAAGACPARAGPHAQRAPRQAKCPLELLASLSRGLGAPPAKAGGQPAHLRLLLVLLSPAPPRALLCPAVLAQGLSPSPAQPRGPAAPAGPVPGPGRRVSHCWPRLPAQPCFGSVFTLNKVHSALELESPGVPALLGCAAQLLHGWG
uniref:Uncharacterized protein n=1 Tax=Geospiza parvula TaxID=87175 RepID=A0A8U8APU3_GEOPR